VPDLILLRHGQSAWNELNLFTGWTDVDLTTQGESEARSAGELLAAETDLDLRVLHTSVLTRAVRTAEITLHAANRSWLPVRRNWRLNERHYGDLTGKDKKETADQFGIEQVMLWRRSYDVPRRRCPRAILAAASPIRATATYRPNSSGDRVPEGRRRSGHAVLRGRDRRGPTQRGRTWRRGHRRRARQLLARPSYGPPEHPEDEIAELEIPTGIPYRVTLDDGLNILSAGYLGDPAAAAAAAEAVARQAG